MIQFVPVGLSGDVAGDVGLVMGGCVTTAPVKESEVLLPSTVFPRISEDMNKRRATFKRRGFHCSIIRNKHGFRTNAGSQEVGVPHILHARRV